MSSLPKLVLASASPRRAEILRNAGFDFAAIPAEIDESRLPAEDALNYVQRLAETKAQAVAGRLRKNKRRDCNVIVGADTVVVIEDEVLGKPKSTGEARRMLRHLNGKWHEVFTGLALLSYDSDQMNVSVEKTRVEFAPLSESEIEGYIGSGEPFDKAGAYAIQGRGGRFILRVEGCYFNVMGLPLARLYSMLRELKPPWPELS